MWKPAGTCSPFPPRSAISRPSPFELKCPFWQVICLFIRVKACAWYCVRVCFSYKVCLQCTFHCKTNPRVIIYNSSFIIYCVIRRSKKYVVGTMIQIFCCLFFFLTMNYTHTVSETIISSMYTTILLYFSIFLYILFVEIGSHTSCATKHT